MKNSQFGEEKDYIEARTLRILQLEREVKTLKKRIGQLEDTGPGTPIARLEYVIGQLWEICGCEDPEPVSAISPETRAIEILKEFIKDT